MFGDTSILREFGINSDGSSKDIKPNNEEYKRIYSRWLGHQVKHKRLYDLDHLARLENLERLQNLEGLQRDYRDVQIPSNAVVYADPPINERTARGINAILTMNRLKSGLPKLRLWLLSASMKRQVGA